jgi:hypothetical protein
MMSVAAGQLDAVDDIAAVLRGATQHARHVSQANRGPCEKDE